jgi:hypothetical protein
MDSAEGFPLSGFATEANPTEYKEALHPTGRSKTQPRHLYSQTGRHVPPQVTRKYVDIPDSK